MKTNVIMDVSNLFYSTFYMYSKEQDNILSAMVNKSFMDTINKYFKQYQPDEVVLAFDGKKNWRKSFTRTANDVSKDICLTFKKYKGNRRKGMTDAELAKLEKFDEFVVDFRDMLKQYTGLLVLQNERLEADDLIGGYIQMHPDEAHIIISEDQDYLQLLRHKNVSLIAPKKNKQLTLIEYDHDPDYFMFQKCIRGDGGDNVMSSYPYIRETKLKEAYEDDFAFNNAMKHTFEVEFLCEKTGALVKKQFVTEEVYEENEMLMDLSKQPPAIRELIEDSINHAIENRGKYNMVAFLRYCGKMDFQHLIQSIGNYNKLLKGPSTNSAFG